MAGSSSWLSESHVKLRGSGQFLGIICAISVNFQEGLEDSQNRCDIDLIQNVAEKS